MPVDTDIPLSVPDALRAWVADARLPRSGAAALPTVRLPDAATSLVFRTTAAGRNDLLVIGPQTRAGYFAGKDLPGCLRLRMRPGRSRPLLDAPPRELVDRVVPLADLWGTRALDLADRLAEVQGDPAAILARLATALPGRVRSRTGRSELSAAAARAMTGSARLSTVASQLAVSERQLRNLFEAEIGVSPKHFARIDRLRRVLDVAGQRGWAELARETGYYDQSHLSADFRAMMGVPPGAFLDGRLPPLVNCA